MYIDYLRRKFSAIQKHGSNVPINPVFSENSWGAINTAFRTGVASQFWSVGDTKSVTLKDGNVYTIRIADMQSGRYELTDGGTSNGVLEFVELVKVGSTTNFRINTSNTNAGGWANSYMRSTTMPEIEALLPDDMLVAISEVNVLSGTGNGSASGTSSSVNKLFLPAEMEIYATRSNSIGIAECPLGQFDYYKSYNADADKIKHWVDNTATNAYWQRSPNAGTGFWCLVNIRGANTYTIPNASSFSVAPIFAI